MAQEMPEEVGHLRGPDVLVGMEPCIQGQTPSLWGDAEGRDGRDLGPSARHRQPGCLPARRPGADHVRDEQEPALVEEDQMGPKRCGLFLGSSPKQVGKNGMRNAILSTATGLF
jgi:hypothetical protein